MPVNDGGATAEGRRCPACAADNDPRRELCSACGVDLDTGGLPPRLDLRTVPRRREPGQQVDTSHRRAWLVAGVAVVAVVASVVGGFAFAEVGPFEREPQVPEADFEAAVYAGEPDVLVLSDIAAMTTLPPEDGEIHPPTHMVDHEPATAWVSDGARLADGVGEKIDLFLAEPAWVADLVVTNGHQLDPEAYAAHARMKRVRLTLDGGVAFSVNLLDQGLERQVVELPEPTLTTSVRLEVLESFPGDTYPNLAVSDLALRGWVAEEGDVELAEERAEVRRAAGEAVLPAPATQGDGETDG